MMNAPLSFRPGPWETHNGAAARSSHAVEIDRFATWLACAKRHPIPVPIGHVLGAGVVLTSRLLLPAYVQHLAVGLLTTGWGEVEITSSSDAYTSVVPVALSSGVTATHTLDQAAWVWAQDRLQGVSVDGLHRALEVDDDSAPQEVTLTFEITDKSGSALCKVHQILVLPMARLEGSPLP